ASVINASFGSDRYSNAEFDAIRKARDAGIIFVAAAGNDGLVNDTNDDYPANYALDNVIGVAATTRTDALATFSNYGSGLVELGAPGSEIYSTYNTSDTAYTTLSGTSMAAPHVTGSIALLKATFPSDSYRQLINRLLRSVTRLPTLSGKVQTGGRLNLGQALNSTTNRPFNDTFAERSVVSGANVRIRSNNEGATVDSGEPSHAGIASTTSLWWSWTAPSSSKVAFDTVGSSYATTLGVYTGSGYPLQSVASNSGTTATTGSRVLLDVVGGTTYQIAVAGRISAFGYTSLRIGTVPKNDDFSNAELITGASVSVSATLLNATRESGEKNPTNTAAGHSIWYKWVAPNSGNFVLSAYARSVDTVAAVYTGSSVSGVTLVAAQDNSVANPANSDALVPFNAISGTTYYLSIDHNSSQDGSSGGDFTMTLTDAAWEYPANDEITSSPAVGADGTIYFGAGSDDKDDKSVYAITSSGTKKWSYPTGNSGIIGASPAIGSDGTVYIGGSDKLLYAIDGATGAKKWSFTAATTISSTPAIGADGTIYFRDNSKLYALNGSGNARWTFDLTGSTDGTYCSPSIGADGTLYVGTNGGAFYAITDNGGSSATQKWKYTADDGIFTSPSIAGDGTIYFATLNGTVYALTDSGSTATKKWSWTAAGNSSITSSIALAADGTLYFAGYDHKLHALTSGGTEKWTYTLGDEVRASSPAVGADGTVYVGCYDTRVYAVTSTGTLLRTYPTAKTIRSSPAIAGNRLYFGSADGKLYSFDIGQAAGSSSWPMFHQNAARTGRIGAAGALTISSQPQSRTLAAGSSATLTVAASGSGALSYQWYKNGSAIPGATGATYTIGNITAFDAGSYTVKVTSGAENVTSGEAVITVVAAGTRGSSLANISTRAYAGTGNNVTIGGFVISGSTDKRVLIRAVGPSLAGSVAAADLLADPTIEIFRGTTSIGNNDNWNENSNAAEITAVGAQIGASPLAASDTKSAALLTTLAPGVYTFIAKGKSDTSGIVLLEVYDVDPGVGSSFANIAARAYCSTNDRVTIGGFVISGTVAKKVLMRAIGPTLITQGVPAGEILADPLIELHSGAPTIGSNDNASSNSNATEIISVGQRLGAVPISTTAPNVDARSSALLIELQPGAYTFIASGVGGTSGIVLVEVYDAD
ncbi:MAG: PQQ-binding-like beta-propeller repeat protein, partial [Opitutus sp.]